MTRSCVCAIASGCIGLHRGAPRTAPRPYTAPLSEGGSEAGTLQQGSYLTVILPCTVRSTPANPLDPDPAYSSTL